MIRKISTAKIVFKLLACYLLFLSPLLTAAQVRLPAIIRDSMILQRDQKLIIWGWAPRGEKITLFFKGQTYKTIAENDSSWKLQLPSQQAGGPYTMTISGKNKIVLHDIWIGDVWLCAGQSNMEHQMKLHNIIYADEIAEADYNQIRQFKVPNVVSLTGVKQYLPGGSWKCANSENIGDFSAVAYFFAKALYAKYHVPVGIINVSWGGIPIQAMMSAESLQAFPDITSAIKRNQDTGYINDINRKAFAQMQSLPQPADKGILERWFDGGYSMDNWKRIAIPGYWEDQGVKDLNGIVWYRKEIDVPASMSDKTAKLFLGRIVDADEVYINGSKIGSTTYLYPQRRYSVPAGILKDGKNIIAVRVTNFAGKGGFVPDKPYELISGSDTIDLSGYWQYKVGAVFTQQKPPETITLQYQPAALYNSMIAPLVGFTLKGFTWYQGESNTGKPAEYAKLQPAMINDWRNKWQQGDIPFLFVQLPGFMDYNYLPSESQWAEFREAQSKSLALNKTAMVVAIDLGEWNDIHPENKKTVGERLALAAEDIAYNEDLVSSGPTYQSAEIEGNKIIISFANTGSGLATTDSQPPEEFAISGADKKFVRATAKISGDKIIIYSDEILSPKFVRYAWADNPVNANLINKEGLPAAPFRTDE